MIVATQLVVTLVAALTWSLLVPRIRVDDDAGRAVCVARLTVAVVARQARPVRTFISTSLRSTPY